MPKTEHWIVISKPGHSGIFVWDVQRVIVDGNYYFQKHPEQFVQCRDGSYIMLNCMHFWTVAEVDNYQGMEREYAEYENFIVIGGDE